MVHLTGLGKDLVSSPKITRGIAFDYPTKEVRTCLGVLNIHFLWCFQGKLNQETLLDIPKVDLPRDNVATTTAGTSTTSAGPH